MEKKIRLGYIDIAKGVLICCLLYGHMILFARMEGFEDPIMGVIQKSIKLYAGFFMQSFFFITGFCSSFSKKLKDFLWNNVKSILIPAIILTLISGYGLELLTNNTIDTNPLLGLIDWLKAGGPWFIITMFWGKIVYWFINRLRVSRQLILLIFLYLLGISLNIFNFFPNYWYHRHVLLMLPYLFLGNFCKTHKSEMDKWLLPMAMFGFFSIIGQFVFSQFVDFYAIPVHDNNIGINKLFPIHIINAITGTAFVLFISKIIAKNNFLETMGKGTLLIYLLNELINRLILHIFPIHNSDNLVICAVFHVSVYVVMLAVSYLLIRLVYDTKYLRWLVGKW